MNVSVIIPCYPPHIKRLVICFNDILNQTVKPYEVILAISETDDNNKCNLYNQYNPMFLAKNISFRIENTTKQQFAGENRNRGAKIAKGEIFMFIDADDQISKFKIEFSLKYMTMYNADMIMHTFAFCQPYPEFLKEQLTLNSNNIRVYDPIQVKKIVFGDPPVRNRIKELKSVRKLCEGFPPGIVMGYPTIKKEVFDKIQFTARARGEDTLFFKDCVWEGFKVIFIKCKLINYIKY
jgi:glycosyltransferase involved in cell wall biosynthesis